MATNKTQTRSYFIDEFKERLGIELTPGGIWKLEQGKKTATSTYSTHRKNHLTWDLYQKDNMAKHYLKQEQQLIILDVDGEYMEYNSKTKEYYIPSLDLTVPNTFYTVSTRKDKFHFYFSIPETLIGRLPSRATKIKNTEVDTFTYGNMFEWHSFAPSHHLNAFDVVSVPKKLVAVLQDLDLPIGSPTEVTPTSHIQRYNLVTRFLNDEIEGNKQWFAFFNAIFPKEYKPENRKKLSIDDYPLSYDLFNKIAVKLTSTAELDHYEHTIPCLEKLLKLWGRDPESSMSQTLMHKNMLPSLPEHEAILKYSQEDDELTFQEHLDQQVGTTTPIFRVVDKTIKFIEIDKLTHEPVIHNNEYLMDVKSAQALHPERDIFSEDGKLIGWDQNVPILYTINDPYEGQYILDDKQQRHVINLYTPSQYIKEAQAISTVPKNNILYKTMFSSIGPRYLEYVLNYHAQVLFGKTSLNMVLWMASLPTDLGGTGKSMATIEILSMIAGGSIQAINEKTAMSGWGDVVASSRLISLEDMTDLGKKEWDQIYAMIKQQTSNSYRKLNMKGSAVATKRVSVSLSGSSNHRPMLPPSDRRFLCLEPAHLRGETEPLSKADSKRIGQVLRSRDYEEDVQVYVNYLYYLHSNPMTDDMYEALYERTPQTEYRAKWVGDGATNTQNIIHSIASPNDLMGIIKTDSELDIELVVNLFNMILTTYNAKTGKAAVSYKWFIELLPLVVAERFKENIYSKHALEKMLQIDFKNVGTIYSNTWRKNTTLPVEEWQTWPTEGFVFSITPEQIAEYTECITGMLIPQVEPLEMVDIDDVGK